MITVGTARQDHDARCAERQRGRVNREYVDRRDLGVSLIHRNILNLIKKIYGSIEVC